MKLIETLALLTGVRRVYAGVPAEPCADARVVPVVLDITDDARLGEVAKTHGDVSILVNIAR